MFAVMTGVMLLADIVFAATGRAWAQWPVLIIMPGTLTLIWLSYTISMVLTCRSKRATPEALDAMARFMGRTLSIAAGVMTVAHLILIATMAGWARGVDKEAFLRLFFTALSVTLILMHNRMPKVLMPHTPPGLNRWYLRASWLGVASGMAMVVIAWTLPIGGMTVPFLTAALLPTVAYVGGALVWRISRRKTS